jgi:hypothetical protein
LMKQGIKPSIVIGFRSGATKLVQTDQSKIKPEDRANAQQIAAKIKTLHTTEGITVVGNGWISLAAYGPRDNYISAE